jgi:hypothetical protein
MEMGGITLTSGCEDQKWMVMAQNHVQSVGYSLKDPTELLEPNIEWLWCYSQLKGKSEVVPVLLTEHHTMKAYQGSGGIAPCIIDLSTRWR